MGKQIKNRLFISFVTLIILMMSILTGKAYADETVDNGRMVNKWYVINNKYTDPIAGSWFYRYSTDWATYCSQNGAPLNDSSVLNSTNRAGWNASPDAALILSAIKNWSTNNTNLNNDTLYDILTNEDDIERETILPDYTKGTGYGYIQNAWWLTDEGKSAINEQGDTGTFYVEQADKDTQEINDVFMEKDDTGKSVAKKLFLDGVGEISKDTISNWEDFKAYGELDNLENYKINIFSIKDKNSFENLNTDIKNDLRSLLNLYIYAPVANEQGITTRDEDGNIIYETNTYKSWCFVEVVGDKYQILDQYKDGCFVLVCDDTGDFTRPLPANAYDNSLVFIYFSANFIIGNDQPNDEGMTTFQPDIEHPGTGNHLYNVATAYESFIHSIVGKDENGNLKPFSYEEANYPDSKTKIQFPKIPEIDELCNIDTSKMDTYFNTEKNNYVIGPITILAETGNTTVNGNIYKFAEISDFELWTNLGKKDCKFGYIEKDENNDEKVIVSEEIPTSGKEFYIVLPYEEGLKEVTNIKFNYKFLKAAANYDLYTGSAQNQAYVLEAARWWDTKPFEFIPGPLPCYIDIEKKATDENEKELTAEEIKNLVGKDLEAKFKVTATYTDGKTDERYTTVKAGTKTTVGPFDWQEGATYTVEEVDVDTNTWTVDSIKNATGDLQQGNTVQVTATNKLTPHKGKIKIDKTLNPPLLEDATFAFQVVVFDDHGDIISEEIARLEGHPNSTELDWTSEEYTWYGNIAPQYTITELGKEIVDAEEKITYDSTSYDSTITNPIGSLSDTVKDSLVTVTAHNQLIEQKPVTLTIKKDIKDGITTDETFRFLLYTTGAVNNIGSQEEPVSIYLKAGNEETFTLYPETGKKVYYNIEEIVENSKTKFDSYIISSEGDTIYDESKGITSSANITKSNDSTIEGYINESEHINVRAINEVIAPNEGSLRIVKEFTNVSTEDIKNPRKVTVGVHVFVPNDVKLAENGIPEGFKLCEEVHSDHKDDTCYVAYPTIDVLGNNAVSFIDIGPFKWYGENSLTYYVEEIDAIEVNSEGENIRIFDNYDVNVKSPNGDETGELKDNDTDTVIIENTRKEVFNNKIQINKTVEGGVADGDELFEFEVEIYKNGNLEEIQTAELIVKNGETVCKQPWVYEKEWYNKNDKYTYEIKKEKAYKYDYDKKEKGKKLTDYNPEGIPAGGALDGTGSVINVDIKNNKKPNEQPVYKEGNLKITKTFDEKANSPRTVRVQVDVYAPGVAKTESNESIVRKIPQGFEDIGLENGVRHHYQAEVDIEFIDDQQEGTWESGNFEWEYFDETSVLEYEVSEISVEPAGNYNVDYTARNGILSDNKTVEIKIDNTTVPDDNQKEYKLKIEKALSDKGNDDKNKEYNFNIEVKNVTQVTVDESTISIDNGSYTDTFKLKPGSSKEFTFKGNEPTYKIVEDENDDYKIESITSNYKYSNSQANSIEGKLTENAEVTVKAVNEQKFSNHISITKQLAGPADNDEYFVFKVTVDGKDTYGALKVIQGNEKATQYATINGTDENAIKNAEWNENSEVWSTSEYSWFASDGAPEYTIEEVSCYEFIEENGQYRNITAKYNPNIPNNKGKLDGSKKEIKVDVMNYLNIKKGYLTIEKILEGAQTTDETFDFKVTVKGSDTVKLLGSNTGSDGNDNTITFTVLDVKANEKRGPFAFAWENSSKDGTETPTYTVEEINTDDKGIAEIKFDSYLQEWDEENKVVNEKHIKGPEQDSIDGTLVSAEEISVDDLADLVVNEDRNVSNVTAVKCTNKLSEHIGKIEVNKEFVDTKLIDGKTAKETAENNDEKFVVYVTVTGVFEYEGKQYNEDKPLAPKKLVLEKGKKWTASINDIKWYGNQTAPKVEVREELTDDQKSKNWSLVSITYDGEFELAEGTNSVTVRNSKNPTVKLYTELGGVVWLEDKIGQKYGEQYAYFGERNGIFDRNIGVPEQPDVYLNETTFNKEDAKVEVFKVYTDNEKVEHREPVAIAPEFKAVSYLDKDNKEKIGYEWYIDEISYPVGPNREEAKYDVEFTFDGQKYEPTTLLKYRVDSNGTYTAEQGNAGYEDEGYFNADMIKQFENSSLAKQTSDESRNISEIKGNSEIDANGDTNGIAVYNENDTSITYHAENFGEGYPVRSTLQTAYDVNNNLKTLFKSTATTKEAGITFPAVTTDINNTDFTGRVTDGNGNIIEIYKVHQDHMKHINLGLVNKSEVDIGLTTNLERVDVVVKNKLYQFKYKTLYDLTEEKQDALELEIPGVYVVKNNEEFKETIGLYKSDYYYRAEIYNNDGKLYDRLVDFYKNLGKDIKDTEMDVYLTYNITVINNSKQYTVKINAIDDYYDENMTLVEAKVEKNIDTKIVNYTDKTEMDITNSELIVDKSKLYNGEDEIEIEWTQEKQEILGSDGIVYNKMKMEANNNEIVLKPGTEENKNKKDIKLSFKVNKDFDMNSVILGQKANVAEIASYSTYYAISSEDQFNGNAIKTYKAGENAGKIDRDSAPANLNISTYNEKKYYEDDTLSAPIIKLQLSDEARNISGTAWEDQRKETDGNGYKHGNGIKDSGIFEKDDEVIKDLTTELVEKVMIKNDDDTYTAYDFVWPTDQVLASLGNNTVEELVGFDSTIKTRDNGDYKFDNVAVGDYVVRFTYGDKEIKTAKYENENSANFYNGQDYKSSIYPNVDTIPTVLDLSKYNNAGDNHSNVAVDNEVRRLQVIQNSREITYENSKVLAAAYDEKYASNKEKLFNDYYMWADTPIIRFNDDTAYNLKNIDFALEERPLTELSLDKQIKEILIKTSDGKTLMDAIYTIKYDVEDGKVKATVSLDEKQSIGIDNLQALNRDDATNNGFRYINVDSDVLQGATISVTYQFTAINSGQIDYTGELADGEWTVEKFDEVCTGLGDNLATFNKDKNNNTAMGKYVGNHYYYGKDKENTTEEEKDRIVTTTVKELVDYLDNDMRFDALLNSNNNKPKWKSSTEDELKDLIESKQIITDRNGVVYSTNGNLLTSINDKEVNESLIKGLEPKSGNYIPEATIELTVSKFVSADSDDLQIDNIAEIIRYTNTVGRRDLLAVTGNTNPAQVYEDVSTGVHPNMPYERDTSATETVTLSPPTGSSLMIWRLQVIGAITAGMVVIAGGIILIKKKVLK